jgi:uncharacterized protein with von Willebrand factor type A (vWA) domain
MQIILKRDDDIANLTALATIINQTDRNRLIAGYVTIIMKDNYNSDNWEHFRAVFGDIPMQVLERGEQFGATNTIKKLVFDFPCHNENEPKTSEKTDLPQRWKDVFLDRDNTISTLESKGIIFLAIDRSGSMKNKEKDSTILEMIRFQCYRAQLTQRDLYLFLFDQKILFSRQIDVEDTNWWDTVEKSFKCLGLGGTEYILPINECMNILANHQNSDFILITDYDIIGVDRDLSKWHEFRQLTNLVVYGAMIGIYEQDVQYIKERRKSQDLVSIIDHLIVVNSNSQEIQEQKITEDINHKPTQEK